MSARLPIVFVHGWGFDAGFWDGVRALLPEFETHALDLGFRGAPSDLAAVPPGPCLAAGHSLGFLWLLRHTPVAWRRLVAINGFSRFTRADGFPSGIDARMVARMMDKIHASPETVVADFFAACGHDDRPGHLDTEALSRGLEGLRTWDGRAILADETVPVLALAGDSDPIVPASLTEACFAGNVQWHEGGHLLPLTAPDWCAERLREFADAP